MNKSKYNNMFKVSPFKRKFLDIKTGILTENGFHELCEYDVHDLATYDTNANFIEDAEQIEYNSCFLAILGNLNINEVKDFFNYHYDYTPNKETYLDYLEFGIINHKWFNEGGIREFVKRLIDEKRKKNEQLIYENQIAVKILGYGKQNIDTKKQTVLNYIDGLLIESDLKPIDAIKILNKSTSNFSPEFKDAHYQNIINYLNSLNTTNEPQQSTKEPESIESKEPENRHPTIFTNGYAYQIFLEWHNKYKSNSDNYKANYSYLIRNMIKDKLIYDVKQGAYLEFLKEYDVNIDKIKLLIECTTTNKDTIYLDTKNAINTRYNLEG